MRTHCIRLLGAVVLALISGPALGQSHESNIRDALVEAIPTWWQVVTLESNEIDLNALDDASEPKNPAAETSVVTGSPKPGAMSAEMMASHIFSAEIELTEDLFEPIRSEGGAALVNAIMSAGTRLQVSGRFGGDDGEPVLLDQSGLESLGRPIDEFETVAYVLGSVEADAFLESLSAARADGTLSKLMNDEGDEL